jgi:O-antigen/teichoic acid export membrane protein
LLRIGGHELNGLFQAAWALDSLLMASITSGLASYFFPRFAAASTPEALQHEVDRAGEFTLLFGGPLILAFGALRHLIITIAYSESFTGASGLLSVLAIADTLKVLGWVAAGPLLYRNQVRAFVVADVTAALMLAGGCQLTVTTHGLQGIGYAQVAAYAVYLPLCAWLLWKLLAVRMRPLIIVRGVLLATAVLLTTTFAQSHVAWLAAAALALPAVLGGSGYTTARRLLERTALDRR